MIESGSAEPRDVRAGGSASIFRQGSTGVAVAGMPLILTGLVLDDLRTMNLFAAVAAFCAPGLVISFLLLRAWKRKADAGRIGARGGFLRAAILLAAATAAPLALAYGNVRYDTSAPRRARATVVRTQIYHPPKRRSLVKFLAVVRFQYPEREHELYISRKSYEELKPGDAVEVEIMDGALGFDWIRAVRKAGAEDGPSDH